MCNEINELYFLVFGFVCVFVWVGLMMDVCRVILYGELVEVVFKMFGYYFSDYG